MTEARTKVVVDCATGETQELPLTTEEIEAHDAEIALAQEMAAQRVSELNAKAEAKASALAKLAALGLTEEEAAAIAGA